ncbi:MAG: BatD family protein [Ginsengibacter sp.]
MGKKFLIRTLFLVFCIISFLQGIGQVKFYAETDSRLIGKEENIEIQFTVKNAKKVDQINAPVFDDFTVISGPYQQSGMTIINGNVSQTVSIGFILHPKRVGTLHIGSATSVADGKSYTSAPLTIQVSNKSVNNNSHSILPFAFDEPIAPTEQEYNDFILKKGENVAEKIKRNVFVKLEVDKTKCYVGEPIIASYKLYSRLKTESTIAKTPSFNGFSVNELGRPDAYSLSNERINGRDYNVYLLRKVELYPLQSGKIDLEPLEVENKITFIEDKRRTGEDIQNMLQGLANGSIGSTGGLIAQTVTLKNKPVTIDVLALPPHDSFPNFKGAVGEFEISAALEKDTTNVEDGGNLTVTIKGKGNIQLVNAPKVNWPNGVDGFEAVNSEKLDKFSVPISGEKYFKYPFSVLRSGKYEIPAITFSYFDVSDHLYHSIKSDPLRIYVDNSVHHHAVVSPSNKESSFNIQAWVFISGGIILLIVALFLFRSDKRRGYSTPSVDHAIEHQPMSLKTAEPKVDFESLLIEQDSRVFYSKLKSRLLDFMSTNLSIQREEITRKKINEVLDKKQVENNVTVMVNQLFDDIDLHLYSASAPDAEKSASYKKAIHIVDILEKNML